MTPEELVQFEERVEPEPMSGCWLWSGTSTGKSGYGLFYFRRRQHVAHRVSFEHFCHPIPAGLEIDHKCQVRCCVNPRHLQLVTPVQNRLLVAQRRTHCRNGHPLVGPNADVRMDPTNYGGYARICRRCVAANMARYKAKPGNHEAMKAYWRARMRSL